MGKTVYVLGAGFSKFAKFPLQKELYPQLVKKVYSASSGVLGDSYLPFHISQNVFLFLAKAGYVDKRSGRRIFDVSLEDLFTLLDRVITDRGTYCGFDWASRREESTAAAGLVDRPSLIEVRESLVRSLLAILHACSDAHNRRSHSIFRRFAASLILRRLKSVQATGDPFSVISLNWDTLWEDSIYRVLDETGGIDGGTALADVDYCVYTNPLEGSPHTPSTKQRASGIYNLKLLKLHGSASWLRCPNSNVIYTGLGSKESSRELYVHPRSSPLLGHYPDARERGVRPFLEPYILTPTFVKVLDLPQIQATWHNAYVELREASEVIFIGYSLPEADHQVRTLLRRAIRSSANIHVILSKKKLGDEKEQQAVIRRFEEIFANGRLRFQRQGTEGFINRTSPDKAHDAVMEELKRRFRVLIEGRH